MLSSKFEQAQGAQASLFAGDLFKMYEKVSHKKK